MKAVNWIRTIRKDEKLQGYLQDHEIQRQFNLSRVPWWLVGRTISTSHWARYKQAMYKIIGGATLLWMELNYVFLDVETEINQRSLSYVEDHMEMPLLTPFTYLFQRPNMLPEKEP